MSIITRWWWVAAAPTVSTGVYVGQSDVAPVTVDASIYDLMAGILPPIHLSYSSPLQRALVVAEGLKKAKDITIPTAALDAFNEQDFGQWEQKTFAEVQQLIEKDGAISREDVPALTPKGGESFIEVTKRVSLAMDTITYQIADSGPSAPINVLCTAPVSVIRAAIAKSLDITPQQAIKITLQPLSLSILEHHEHMGWSIHATGWTPWPMVR